MNRLALSVPWLLIALAVVHFVWAFAQPHTWAEIAGEGFLSTVVDTDAPDYFAREMTVWFMVTGVALLALGTLSLQVLRTTGRLPAQVGWYMLAIGVPLCVIYFPIPGPWPMLVIGVLGLIAARRPDRPT